MDGSRSGPPAWGACWTVTAVTLRRLGRTAEATPQRSAGCPNSATACRKALKEVAGIPADLHAVRDHMQRIGISRHCCPRDGRTIERHTHAIEREGDLVAVMLVMQDERAATAAVKALPRLGATLTAHYQAWIDAWAFPAPAREGGSGGCSPRVGGRPRLWWPWPQRAPKSC